MIKAIANFLVSTLYVIGALTVTVWTVTTLVLIIALALCLAAAAVPCLIGKWIEDEFLLD